MSSSTVCGSANTAAVPRQLNAWLPYKPQHVSSLPRQQVALRREVSTSSGFVLPEEPSTETMYLEMVQMCHFFQANHNYPKRLLVNRKTSKSTHVNAVAVPATN